MKRILLFTGIIALLSFDRATTIQSQIIEGVIVSEQTGKPIPNLHVYTVQGEEESLTDNKGYFKIESWQTAPFRLVIENKGIRVHTCNIKTPDKKQYIKIKK